MFVQITEKIHSAEFARDARHVEFPNAFTRSRKLPLPCLVGALLSMRGQSQQVMLDAFFGSLSEDGHWQRQVSDRGFAKARDRLAWSALERLNTFVSCSAAMRWAWFLAGMVCVWWRQMHRY